jgi:hypothetical protein
MRNLLLSSNAGMASVLTRCKSCHHKFVKHLHRCPECGARSPLGKYAIIAKAGAIAGTVAALTVAFVLVRKLPVQPGTHQSTSILAPSMGEQEVHLQ